MGHGHGCGREEPDGSDRQQYSLHPVHGVAAVAAELMPEQLLQLRRLPDSPLSSQGEHQLAYQELPL